MGQWAVVQSGTVVQSLVIDADTVEQFKKDGVFPDAQWVDLEGVDPQPGPGWTYAGGEFSNPAAEVSAGDSSEDGTTSDRLRTVQDTLDFLVMILTDTAGDDGSTA